MDSVQHFQALARYNAWATQIFLHSLPFAATLAHVFNHSTHQRRQITAALTARGQPAPELDMVYMLQAENQPKA
jgi:uncharacterized damage-inducible protein DinB